MERYAPGVLTKNQYAGVNMHSVSINLVPSATVHNATSGA